jgi:hypothetical protein
MDRTGHSLAGAVADGTISEESAYCGLSPDDLQSLAGRHPSAEVLVRLRSRDADGRTILRARDLAAWSRSDATLIADGRAWRSLDIRDVLAIGERESE